MAMAERSRSTASRPYDDLDTLAMVYLALGPAWQPSSSQPQVNRDLSLQRLVNSTDDLSVRNRFWFTLS